MRQFLAMNTHNICFYGELDEAILANEYPQHMFLWRKYGKSSLNYHQISTLSVLVYYSGKAMKSVLEKVGDLMLYEMEEEEKTETKEEGKKEKEEKQGEEEEKIEKPKK